MLGMSYYLKHIAAHGLGPILLEKFALTTNFKVYAETCIRVIFSSLGCLSCIFSYEGAQKP